MTYLSRIDRFATWFIAALLLLVPLVHSSRLAHPFVLPKEILMLAGALLLLAMMILSYLFNGAAPRRSSPALLLAWALLACAALAIVTAANRGLAVNGLIQMAAGVTIFWAVTRFVRTPGAAALLLRGSLAAAALVSLGTILQVFAPGFHITFGAVSLLPPSSAGATLGDAGLAAQFLLLALPLGIGAVAMTNGRWQMVCGGCVGLVLAALLLCGRPEGWQVAGVSLAMLLGSQVLRASRGPGRWRALIPDLASPGFRAFLLGVVALAAVLSASRVPALSPSGTTVAPLEGTTLLSPTSGDPWRDRAAAARGTVRLIGRHPLGVGPQNWRHAFLEVAWPQSGTSPFSFTHQAQHVGNSFLEVAAETGIAGGALFILLVTVLLVQTALAGTAPAGIWGITAYTCFNFTATFCVIALVASPFQQPTPSLLFWVTAGLAQVALLEFRGLPTFLRWLQPAERPPVPRVLRRPSVGWIAAIAWSVLVVVAGLRADQHLAASHDTLVGQAAIYAGQYEKALLALSLPAARRSPDHLPHALAGDAYLKLGLNHQAVDAFTRVLARSPHYLAAYVGRASAYEAMGRYDLAAGDLDAALSVWSDSPAILLSRGRVEARRGRLESALEFFKRAVGSDPSMAEPYFRLGEILHRLGRLDVAIGAYRMCGKKNPRYPGLQVGLGDAFYEKGAYKMALQYYQAATRIDETDMQALLKTANTQHALGQVCEALESLRFARDLETDAARRGTILELIERVEPACVKTRTAR